MICKTCGNEDESLMSPVSMGKRIYCRACHKSFPIETRHPLAKKKPAPKLLKAARELPNSFDCLPDINPPHSHEFVAREIDLLKNRIANLEKFIGGINLRQ
jgi:hypothetical protein